VQGFHLANRTRTGIRAVLCDHVTIRGNVLEHNGTWGNTIVDNGAGDGGSGINCDGVQDSIIRNNLIHSTHASGISLYRDDGGAPSHRNQVLGNTVLVASDGRWALNVQDDSTGTVVRNNISWSQQSFRAMDLCAGCLTGFTSNHNLVENRFTPTAATRFSRWPNGGQRSARTCGRWSSPTPPRWAPCSSIRPAATIISPLAAPRSTPARPFPACVSISSARSVRRASVGTPAPSRGRA
jgi:hypothetical protein